MEKLKTMANLILQRVLLALPFLSEGRLATSRVLAFLKVWHYLSRAGVAGDYLEFGVWKGMSFDLSMRAAGKFFPKGRAESPRFFAFDSFQGLPQPDGQRDAGVFQKGEYTAERQEFERRIRGAAKGWEVHTVAGFYEKSLTPQVVQQQGLRRAAFVTIDCDLYQSTLEALRFVTPVLQTGSVIFFDDWFFSGGDLDLGEAGACADWLRENPHLTLIDFGLVGIMGKLFIVNPSQK